MMPNLRVVFGGGGIVPKSVVVGAIGAVGAGIVGDFICKETGYTSRSPVRAVEWVAERLSRLFFCAGYKSGHMPEYSQAGGGVVRALRVVGHSLGITRVLPVEVVSSAVVDTLGAGYIEGLADSKDVHSALFSTFLVWPAIIFLSGCGATYFYMHRTGLYEQVNRLKARVIGAAGRLSEFQPQQISPRRTMHRALRQIPQVVGQTAARAEGEEEEEDHQIQQQQQQQPEAPSTGFSASENSPSSATSSVKTRIPVTTTAVVPTMPLSQKQKGPSGSSSVSISAKFPLERTEEPAIES
ncbi:hypothetical protein Pelo_5687 [Pelomyxa schiedti]|nr:hypothetical protein Pelo_5687 [Pelomyxa schiedti]